MSHPKHSSKDFDENLVLRPISQLGTPIHKPSLIGRIGTQVRLLWGPKSLFLGLAVSWLAFGGGRFLVAQVQENQAEQADVDTASNTALTAATDRAPAQSVTLQTAQLATVESSLSLTGTVVPKDLLRVTPAVSGLPIVEMRVRAGDRVQTGQIIAILDSSLLQADLAQAEANLAQAQAELEQQEVAFAQAQVLQAAAGVDVSRYSSLYREGAVSQEQLGTRQIEAATAQGNVAVAAANIDSARASVASRLAEINKIQAQRSQTVVTAPTDGIVAERLMTIGDTASASTPLYSLIENGQLELALEPSQAQLEQIQVGAPVVMSAAADRSPEQNSELTVQGSVRTIDPTLDADSRQATVRVSINDERQLRPGMFLQAEMVTGRRRSVVIPAAAAIAQPDGTTLVYTLGSDNKVQANPVEVASQISSTTSKAEQPTVEVLSGVSAGSQIIVGGASYLQDGDTVDAVQ